MKPERAAVQKLVIKLLVITSFGRAKCFLRMQLMNTFRITAQLAAATALLSFATVANAGASSGTMAVSANVLNNCTIVALPMAFGASITNVGTSNIDTTATLTLACTPNASFYVSMDNGANAASGARRMKGAVLGEYLPYEIYTSATRSQRWGQSSGVDTVAGTAPTGIATLTAYGRIASGASAVSADAYTDSVTVTVNF